MSRRKAAGKRAKKGRSIAEMPMAPMIDMVFLLLVFFMCVSSMSQSGMRVKVELPESAASETPDDLSGRLVVGIDKEGQAYLNGRAVPPEELPGAFASLAKSASGPLKVNIRADRGAEFRFINKVIESAASAGIHDYLYATHQSD